MIATIQDAVQGELGIILLAFIGILAIVAIATFVLYSIPYLLRMLTGESTKPADCCPPGLGCNDPKPEFRQCRRLTASRMGTVTEFSELDALWARFNALDPKRRRARSKAHAEFAFLRDDIISRGVAKAATGGKIEHPALEAKHAATKKSDDQMRSEAVFEKQRARSEY